MSGSLLDEKENFSSTNEVAKEEEVFPTSSILKPSQKENVRQLTAKKPPKVTFKNTPVRHCPTRYKVEQPIKLLDTWEEIRCLDEVENWTERTQVVTKEDHQLHLDSAKEFLDNIIDNLSCFRSPKKHIIFESYKEKDSSSPTEDKSKIMDDALDIAGPLDPAIASLNSLLKAGEEEERAFSPIGSGKASPDCDNMVTSDDIEKLLAPHDVPDEIEIPTLELLHGNKIDAFMDSKFSGRHLDEVAAKLNELKLTSTKTNSIYDDNDLLVKPRGSKQSPPTIQSQETKNDSDFDLPVKPRGAKKPVAAVVPQEDKTEDDLPIKPRGAKQPMAAVVPQEDKTDDDFDLPIKPRGAKQPMTAVVPQEEKTEDDFDLPIKPRGAKQPMAAVVPQEEKTEDDFDLPIKPRGAKQPMAAVIPQEEKTDDDFDLPIKPRGAKQPMAAVVPQEEKTDDDLPIKPRGAKQPMATVVPQEEKTEDDFDLPIKPRGAKQPMAAVVPQEDNTEDDFDLPVKPRGMRKSPPTVEAQEDKNDQVTENGNDGENLPVKKRQPKTAKKKEADQVNGEENETFKKPMPPKPWKTKKKKAPQSDDPFTIMFAEPAKSISTNDKSASSPAEQKPLSQSNEVNSMETKPSEQDMNITNREMSSSEDGVMLSDQQQDLGFTNDDFKSGNAFSLELDYLEKFGNTNDLDRLSALARQSLYVKFDPLCKGRSPDLQGSQKAGADANFSKQTPGNVDDLLMNTPPNRRAPTSKLASIKEDKAGSNLTSVDRLLTFSPVAKGAQPAETETAKPPSPTESKLTKADDAALVQPLLYSKSDIETAVKKEREALLKQTHEESQVRDMEIQDILSKLQTEVENNSKLKRENDELKTVMKEYEKTMAEMIESTEKDKNMADESKNEIVKERDQLQADLNSVEAAFSDLHRRYEKMKGALENFKKNEEILKKAAQDYQEKLRKSSEKYQMLKKHAEEKIETANIEINRVRRSNDSEMAVMRAALKKEQNKSASLEQAVQQKINENKELTAICDELIQRASGK